MTANELRRIPPIKTNQFDHRQMKLLHFSSKIDLASLLLRVSVGGMFVLHGIGKAFVVGIDSVIEAFLAQGFPIWTVYFSTVLEILGGILLLLGLHTRAAALVLMPITVGILVYHFPNGWAFQSAGGGWEYPQLILIALLAIFLLDSGTYKVKNILLR